MEVSYVSGTIGHAASAANENPLLVVKLGAAAELAGKAADIPVVIPLGAYPQPLHKIFHPIIHNPLEAP